MELQFLNEKTNLKEIKIVKDLKEAGQFSRELNKGRNYFESLKIVVIQNEFKIGLFSDIPLTDLFWLHHESNIYGMQEFILALEAEAAGFTDKEFWAAIKKMKWDTDFSFKRIQKELTELNFGDISVTCAISRTFFTKKLKLKEAIATNIDNNNLDYYNVIGLGDDSLDDLCSNIIGLGEEIYNKAMEDVVFAGKQDTNESFAYAFNFEDLFK